MERTSSFNIYKALEANYFQLQSIRCGGSKNKPFCKGTRSIIGFSRGRISDRRKDRRINYDGEKITVHDNLAICSHANERVNNLSSALNLNTKPWIEHDAAPVHAIVDSVTKCPSGPWNGLSDYSRREMLLLQYEITVDLVHRPLGAIGAEPSVESTTM